MKTITEITMENGSFEMQTHFQLLIQSFSSVSGDIVIELVQTSRK